MTTLAFREFSHGECYYILPGHSLNCATCVNVVSTSSSQDLIERPAKRARVGLGKADSTGSTRVGHPKRGRGCLSELPTMILDVLFEVCSLRSLIIENTSDARY